jgi:GGDEF domain-containing protein
VISGVLKTQYLEKLSQTGVNQIIQEPIDPASLKNDLEELILTCKSEEKLNDLTHKIGDFPSAADIRLRPFFSKNLLAPILLSIKEGKKLSLLAIDIEYNETHEYTERDLTKIIKKIFPEIHPLISLGRGKYLIFLNQMDIQDAKFLGETLRDVITHTLQIGIKIGISSQKKPPYANIREMILAAKMALLEAQKKGTTIEIY